ncbi:MAG: hypothetical protein ACO3Y3_03690 [Phycisphaerales bacterium]|jgi:hypothetical protein
MPSHHPSTNPATPRRGAPAVLLHGVYDLFSSVRFGIVLLAILFVYMAVGSAGLLYPIHPNLFHPDAWVHAQIRQWRPFEMTEFEWFHWWPFDVLVILICANIAVTTLRRIPFRPINYGVWMIHTGILILAVGSFIYFGTKVEGDTPVLRRLVVASFAEDATRGEGGESAVRSDGAAPAPQPGLSVLSAVPSNRATLSTPRGSYGFEVVDVDPEWELLSGENAGERAYSVSVMVESPTGERFIRQVIAGHPEYTEDLVFTQDPEQPMKRSVKLNGDPIVDESLRLELGYQSQEWFYLKHDIAKNWALYLRRPGEREWVERPIDGLPLYNDYIADRSWVFQSEGPATLPIHPIDLEVPPVSADDPAPSVDFEISGYLRYALERSRILAGGPSDPFNPTAFMTITSNRGERSEYRLQALDPEGRRADGGLLAFRSVDSEAAFEAIVTEPTLRFEIPSLGFVEEAPIRSVLLAQEDLAFSDLGDTGYAYRVAAVQDEIPLSTGVASIAILEIRTPDAKIVRRWVFDDPRLTRDVGPDMAGPAHGGPALIEDSIAVEYRPGTGMALLTLVVGPEPERLRLVNTIGTEKPESIDLGVGRPVEVPGGLTVTLDRYMPRARIESKPFVVPQNQRDRDAGTHFAMIRLAAPGGEPQWLRFHQYAFEGPEDYLRRFRFEPQRVRLADGSEVEVLFSRKRMRLPAEIALEEFILTAHVGGFTGESGSIRNWTSLIRFKDEDGWTEPQRVSVNDPVAYGGYSYFQAQWDPPDPARGEGDRMSRGLNYTVLGVGNRHGIYTQLAGCTISVIGMIYAFYVKPVIRRRHLERAAAKAKASVAASPSREPAMAGGSA